MTTDQAAAALELVSEIYAAGNLYLRFAEIAGIDIAETPSDLEWILFKDGSALSFSHVTDGYTALSREAFGEVESWRVQSSEGFRCNFRKRQMAELEKWKTENTIAL